MNGGVTAAGARPEIVLQSRRARRALAGSAGQHVATAVMLVGAGFGSLDSGRGPLWLALASVVVGVVLVVAAIREIRALRRHGIEPDKLPLVDFLAVPLLALEAVHKHEQGLHLIPWAYGFLALATLVRAVAWPRLARIRRARIDETGIDIRTSPWRRTRVAWSAVEEVTEVHAGLRLTLRDGSVRILRLRGLDNRGEVEAAILAAAPPEACAKAEPGSRDGR